VNQSFSLDPNDDLDIIKWLGEQANISLAIRLAIRKTMTPLARAGSSEEVITMLQGISADVAKLNQAIGQGIITVASNENKKEINKGELVPEVVLKNMRSLKV
jgi:ABC-type sulfate transport system substrate-binding protein